MAAVASCTVFCSLFMSGLEVVFPLWATRELGVTASEWAHLRSLRLTGSVVGAVVLGALSDRFGTPLFTALSLLATGASVLLLAADPTPRTLWLIMPLFGAVASTVFMNLNSLTQQVTLRRQGLANSIYRGIWAVAGVISPVIATILAGVSGSYRPVFAWGTIFVVFAAAAVWRYPEAAAPGLRTLREEFRGMWEGYRGILSRRRLMRFMHLTGLGFGVLSGVSTFGAIYFTQALGRTDPEFGSLAGVAGLLTVGAIAIGAFYLDRCPLRGLTGVLMLAMAASSVLMGAVASVPVFSGSFLVFTPVLSLSMSPLSMWVAREAGEESQTAAFAVQKVLGAGYVVVCTLALGWLEVLIGMRLVFVGCGLLGAVLGAALFLLPAPPAAIPRSQPA